MSGQRWLGVLAGLGLVSLGLWLANAPADPPPLDSVAIAVPAQLPTPGASTISVAVPVALPDPARRAWQQALLRRHREKLTVLLHQATVSGRAEDIAAAELALQACAPWKRVSDAGLSSGLSEARRLAQEALSERCDTQGRSQIDMRRQLRALLDRLPSGGDDVLLLGLLTDQPLSPEERRRGLRIAAATGSADLVAAVLNHGDASYSASVLALSMGLRAAPQPTGWMKLPDEALPQSLLAMLPAGALEAWRQGGISDAERNSNRMLDDLLIQWAARVAACAQQNRCESEALLDVACTNTGDCVDDLRQWAPQQLFDPQARSLLKQMYTHMPPAQLRQRWEEIQRWLAQLQGQEGGLTAP